MKLYIKRDQKTQTGVFGGHKGMTFVLSCRVDLNPQEQELVSRYKAEMYPLTFTDDPKLGRIAKTTVSGLMRGVTEEVKDITVLLNNEEVIKGACKNFKTLLDVMATFGGEDVVEFSSEASAA
jgi:hypothetical protein